MKKIVVVCALVLGVLLGAGGTAFAGRETLDTKPPHVVSVTGNRVDGFHVRWNNGWTDRYASRDAVVAQCQGSMACRTGAEKDFYWMTQMRRALRHAG